MIKRHQYPTIINSWILAKVNVTDYSLFRFCFCFFSHCEEIMITDALGESQMGLYYFPLHSLLRAVYHLEKQNQVARKYFASCVTFNKLLNLRHYKNSLDLMKWLSLISFRYILNDFFFFRII